MVEVGDKNPIGDHLNVPKIVGGGGLKCLNNLMGPDPASARSGSKKCQVCR
jgi:hypothetical protein